MMKNLYHIARLLIPVILVLCSLETTGQINVETFTPPYSNVITWGTGPGIADCKKSGNRESGALSAFCGAYVGASAAEAFVVINAFNPDSINPTWMKVEAEILHQGATHTGEFGAFAGTRVFCSSNGKRYYRDINPGLTWVEILDKVISIAQLALPGTSYASLTGVQKVFDVIEKINTIREYWDYYETLKNMLYGETEKISYEFRAIPGYNEIHIGVRADAAAFLTSSGFALIFGQVVNAKVTMRGADGHWYPADNSVVKWIDKESGGEPNELEWWDKALKDFVGNAHSGTYHPFAASATTANYLKRRDVQSSNVIELPLNTSGYNDEYFELDFSDSERNALSTEGTFEAWVNPVYTSTFTGHIIHASYDHDGDEYGADGWGSEDEIHLSCNESGAYSFYIGGNGEVISINSGSTHYNPSDGGGFDHVVGSYINKNGRMEAWLYVNGTMVASDSWPSTANISLNTFLIGKPAKDTRHFHGKLHDIRIRQNMVTPQEVQLAYWQGGGDTDNPSVPVLNDLPEFSPSTTVLVSWEPSTDPTSYVDYYEISCKNVNTSATRRDTVYGTSYLDTLLADGITYQYKVKAVDVTGRFSAFSDIITTTIDTTPPMQPVLEYIEPYTAGTSVKLNWSCYGADSFMVYYSTSENFSTESTVLDSTEWISPDSIELSGFTMYNPDLHSETYYFKVKAKDANFISGFSEIESTTFDNLSPFTPDLFATDAYTFGNEITLDWESSDLSGWDNCDDAEINFQVQFCNQIDFDSVSATYYYESHCFDSVSTFTLKNLPSNTTLYFRVNAYDGAGNKSAWSNTENTTTCNPRMEAEPLNTAGSSNNVYWFPTPGNFPSIEYQVQCSDNDVDSLVTYATESGWITDTTWTFSGLDDNQTYYYRVKAKNADDDETEWSDWVSSTQDYDIPEQPFIEDIPAEVNTNWVQFRFINIDCDYEYILEYAKNSAFSGSTLVETGCLSSYKFHFPTTMNDETVWFRIRGKNGTKYSEYSNVVSTYYNPDPALMEYIYYVSPTGNDGRAPNVAMSYDTPWRTIQHAVDNSENGGIIKVAGGIYEEDVIINKPVTVQALNNNIMPEVTGPAGPAFTIYSDSVCLSYLKLYTSYFLNRAAVKAQTVQAVQIDHCTIGISTTENAYYGIWFNNVRNSTIESNTIDFNTEGIYLSNSTNNTLYSNNIHYSEETGLSLYLSDINSIINNDVFEQPTALVINNSTYNNFSYNIFMESDLNIYLTGSSGRNQFCQNGITWGTTGISNNCPADHENKFYLNYLNNNTLDIETTHGENCNMQSPLKFAYRHNSIAYKNYIGNSYTDYTWNDIDNNALGDTPYSFDNNGEDKYPVTNGRDFNIRSWFLSSDHSLPEKSDQKGGDLEIQNGETYHWVSSKLFSYTDFPEGSDRWEINWLIKLALKQAITAGGTFQIDVGYSPSSTGAPFYTTGITGTFDKNDASDFDSRIFYLGLEPEAMDLPRGQYLVLNITNQTGETMTVKTGGSWSYLTPPPSGTCAPYILNDYGVTIEEDSQTLCTCAPFCWQNHVWDPDTPFEDLEITFTDGEHVAYILDHEDFVGTGYRFVPEENWSGFDTLWMHVSDGNASNSRTFIVYVSPVDDTPEIDTAFVHYMNEDGQSLIYNSQYEAFFGQFVEDPDNDFDELFFTVETIDLNELGAYNYNSILLRPYTNFNGWTSYRLIVSDGELADTAECKVYVNPVNDFPEVKFNFTLNMDEDETVTWGFDHTGYRWNTSTWTFPYEINDVDTSDSLIVLSNNLADLNDTTFMIVIESSGHIDVGISGNDFTFSNNTEEWSGNDILTITVYDPAIDTTYTIEKAWPVVINATNDRPQLTGQPVIRFNEDESLWIKVDTLGNYFADNDNSDDELFISIISNNVLVKENGNAYYTEYHYSSLAGDDSIKFFAPQNWFGNDTLTVRVHDGFTPSTIGHWVVTVDPVNDAPVAGTLPDIRFNEDDTLYVNRSFFTDRISDAETPDSLLLITIHNGIKVRCTDLDTAFLFTSFENANGTETLNVIVSDGELADTTTLFCRIDPINDAPVIDSLPKITFPEDQFPEYNQNFWYAYVEDVENNDQSLTYQVIQGNNVSIGRDGNDDHDRFVCSWNWFGTDTLKLRVFDGLLADTAIFIVEVTPVNDVPVVGGLPACTMQEDDTLSLAFSWFYPYISDVETPDSLLIPDIQGNSHITVETADTLFRFIPEADWNGSAYLIITASDGDTISGQEYFHIVVHPVNDSIHIVFPDTITVTEDVAFDFEVEIDNHDNDDCGWWLENRPSWIHNNTQTVFGQFGEGTSEDCTFKIIGWEIGGLTDTLEVFVDVIAVNDPPVIRFPDTIYTQASTALNEQIIANDPEDSTLVFSLGNHPDWLLLNDQFINGTTPADFSDTSFVLIASDGELNDTAIVALIDSVLPLPKVIITSDDYINGTEDVELEYIASAFSPMGMPAMISFQGLPAWLVQDGDTLTGTPPNGVLSDTICVIGTNGFSENDSMDVFISITPINDPPVITSAKIAFGKEDSSFVYKAEGSDEEGDPLNFHFDYDQTWLFTAGDSLYGTPPEGVLEFQFILTVSDGQLSNAQLVLVNITAVNDPPVLTTSDTIQVYEDIAFEYLATGDDAEDSTITITFDQVPTWMTTSGDTISGTPDEGTADTTFVVHISDGELNPGYVVTVIMNAINDEPTLDSLPAIDGTEDTPFDIVFAGYETFAHDTDNVFSELNWEVDGSSSVFTVVSHGNTSATLTPPENWSGSSSVEVTVDDGEYYASRIVSVTIDPVNDAPVAEAFPELQMNEDQTIYKNMEFFTSRFSDVETPVDSLEFTISDGLIVKPTKLDTAVRFDCFANQFGVDTLNIIVSDGDLQDTALLVIEVTSVNDVPVIDPTPDFNMNEDDTLKIGPSYFYPYISDIETPDSAMIQTLKGSEYAYAGSSQGDTMFMIIPNSNWNGSTTLTYSITDMDTIVSHMIGLNVSPVNDSIQLVFDDTISITEGIDFSFEVDIENADGDSTFWGLANNPAWMLDSGNVIYGIYEDEGADFSFRIGAGEIEGLTDTLEVWVDFIPLNDAPELTSPTTEDATEDVHYAYNPSATDDENDPLVYSYETGEPWLFTAGDSIYGTPPEGTLSFSFRVSVSDGSANDHQMVNVDVQPVNDPPAITSATSINIDENVELNYTPTGDDPEDSTLTYTFLDYPSWLGTTANNIWGTPEQGPLDTSFVVRISDGELEADFKVDVHVNAINDAPVIDPLPGVSGTEDSTLTILFSSFEAYVHDEDNTPEELNWQIDTTGSVFSFVLSNDTMVTLRPPANWNSTSYVRLVVDDGELSARKQLRITIDPVNDAPILTSAATDTATVGELFVYHATATDAENDPLTFSYDSDEEWLESVGDSIYGTPPGGTLPFSFQIIVSDGELEDTLDVDVEVESDEVPENNQVSNYIAPPGVAACFDATETITVAGDGTDVVLGNATNTRFIAGSSIRFLPGFHAHVGSYVHAYITTDATFCEVFEEQSIVQLPPEQTKLADPKPFDPFRNGIEPVKEIKVYPNPNNGRFNVEFYNFSGSVNIAVVNTLGSLIYHSNVDASTRAIINVPNAREGLYQVIVTDSKTHVSAKMIIFR